MKSSPLAQSSVAAAARIDSATSWFQVSPYGRFPNSAGLQIVDQTAAAQMVDGFEREKRQAGASWRGKPIFVGHPDLDRKTYPDGKKYGAILALEARAGGVYAHAKWSRAGRTLIAEQHFDFPSPHWDMVPVTGERGAFRPVSLVSIGLTNMPNINVEPFRELAANEDNLPLNQNQVGNNVTNTHNPMSKEAASERWHRLIYQQVMSSGESRDKAWEYCQHTFPGAFAEYEAETAANESEMAAANEAAFVAKQSRNAARALRTNRINAAVDDRLQKMGGNLREGDYHRAYAAVQRERPDLFVGLGPDPVLNSQLAG